MIPANHDNLIMTLVSSKENPPEGVRTIRVKPLTVRDICAIGVFTAVIAVCAQISIPMPYGIPLTLQTLAVPLAGIILGPRNGTFSVLSYLLLGIVGVPVFAGLAGGPAVVFGPTGGFLLSFPFMAHIAGKGDERRKLFWLVTGLVAGTIINYLCGMLYFQFVMSSDFEQAFSVCVLPFMPTAFLKIVCAAVFGRSLKKVLIKNKVYQ